MTAFAKTTAPSPTPSTSLAPATPSPAPASPTAVPPLTPEPAPITSAAPVITSAPSVLASPTPTPVPVPVPDQSGGSVAPGAFVTSIPTPSQVSTEPLVVAQSLGLAALIVLLMPFPAQLFNSTLEEHYGEVRRWFRLDRLEKSAGAFGGFWNSALGIIVFVAVAALIYALLDPQWGPSVAGLVTFVGLALGIVLTTTLASTSRLTSAARQKEKWHVKVLPATLLVGLACVVISRLTGFLPGYVYGVILGFAFVRVVSTSERGRANATTAGVMLVVAVVAWLLLAALVPAVGGVLGTLLSTVLAMTLVACLEGVVFGLLPFRFLPGEPVFSTNRVAWAALLGIGAFLFFHILINPSSGYLSTTTRTPFLTIVALFIGFGVLSVAFWAYFRRRGRAETPS